MSTNGLPYLTSWFYTVVVPGFHRGRGATSPLWSKNPLFGKSFAENCMKMKEMGWGEGGVRRAPPNVISRAIVHYVKHLFAVQLQRIFLFNFYVPNYYKILLFTMFPQFLCIMFLYFFCKLSCFCFLSINFYCKKKPQFKNWVLQQLSAIIKPNKNSNDLTLKITPFFPTRGVNIQAPLLHQLHSTPNIENWSLQMLPGCFSIHQLPPVSEWSLKSEGFTQAVRVSCEGFA